MPTRPPPERQRSDIDRWVQTWRSVGIGFLIGLVLCAGLMLYMTSDYGKAQRLAGMRKACAAGRAEPLNCIKEGVPMTWVVQGESK